MENFNQFCLPAKEFISNDGEVLMELEILINRLDKCFKKDSDNFAETCFIVYRIKKLFDDYKQVYVANKNVSYNFDTIMTGFGISKSESSRLLSCYEKFIRKETHKPVLFVEFCGFSKCKLFELLQVDNEQIIEDLQTQVLRYEMSVATIRKYVKNLQELKKQQARLNIQQKEKDEEIIEEDIPMAYNPQQHYDFDYFENKNKAQLLNIVWELQKEYEKLKTSYFKLKKGKN